MKKLGLIMMLSILSTQVFSFGANGGVGGTLPLLENNSSFVSQKALAAMEQDIVSFCGVENYQTNKECLVAIGFATVEGDMAGSTIRGLIQEGLQLKDLYNKRKVKRKSYKLWGQGVIDTDFSH